MSEDRLKFIKQKLIELEQQKEELLLERETLLRSNKTKNASQQELSADQRVELFMRLFKGANRHICTTLEKLKG